MSRLESELIKNTALRDILDKAEIAHSVKRLETYRDELGDNAPGNLYRVLARSLAKLGRGQDAIDMANIGLTKANEKASIKDIGNAQLALGEALRYNREYEDAKNAYSEAIMLAAGISNRDSLLWSKLGLICLHIEHGKIREAKDELSNFQNILSEPGFEHPIEQAHAAFLNGLISFMETGSIDSAKDYAKQYKPLNIDWPLNFIDELAQSGDLQSIPI